MTPEEYLQLKAFARQDGVVLALLWTASFACYIAGLGTPFYGTVAVLLALATPLLVVRQLRRYRDYGREGVISLRRAWAYIIQTFFYAGLLFAIAQYVYFAYLDGGYLMEALHQMMSTDEAQKVFGQMGISQQAMEEEIQHMKAMRPIDLSLSVLTTNIMMGIAVGLPVAAVMARRVKVKS